MVVDLGFEPSGVGLAVFRFLARSTEEGMGGGVRGKCLGVEARCRLL